MTKKSTLSNEYIKKFQKLNDLFVEPKFKNTLAISKDINAHYTAINIPKKRGGTRLISIPDEDLTSIQRKILPLIERALLIKDKHTEYFEDEEGRSVFYKPGSNSFGFEKKKNITMNAMQHKDGKYFLKIDIHQFFSSISFYTVCDIMHECLEINEKSFKNLAKTKQSLVSLSDVFRMQLFGNPENENKRFRRLQLEQMMANFLCQNGALATGACTSPLIANFYMRDFDKRMVKYLYKREQRKGQEFVYTRYADDITISSDKPISISVLQFVTELLEKFGLHINEEKTHFQSWKSKNVITGINVTPDGRLTVGRRKKEQVKKMLYQLVSGTLSDAKKASLFGNLSFVYSVEPEWLFAMLKKYTQYNSVEMACINGRFLPVNLFEYFYREDFPTNERKIKK